MKMNSLNDMFMDELKDAYDFEKQIVKALPKMIKAASTPELQDALEHHMVETEGQVERLERVFEICGVPAKTKKCEGLRGILDEGEDIISQDGEPTVIDAGIIAGAQKVEHYEMATYGTLCTWAEQLGVM